MAIKITKKASEQIIPFYKLELGAVFMVKERDALVLYEDGYKYMKVRSNSADCNYNAVNLTNGCFSLEKIDSDLDVIEIPAELILEDNDY